MTKVGGGYCDYARELLGGICTSKEQDLFPNRHADERGRVRPRQETGRGESGGCEGYFYVLRRQLKKKKKKRKRGQFQLRSKYVQCLSLVGFENSIQLKTHHRKCCLFYKDIHKR